MNKKGTLLLVDDEDMIRDTLSLYLEDCADIILSAPNAIAALEMLNQNEVHCVLCDIQMPKMSGIDLIKVLRENGSDIPFIFFTGHGNEKLMQQALEYGAFDFLDKPQFDGLAQVITNGLRKGLGLDQIDSDEKMISDFQKMLRAQKTV